MTNQKITGRQARKIHKKFIKNGLYRLSIDELRHRYVFLNMENTVLKMKLEEIKNDRKRGSMQRKINFDKKTNIARLLAAHVLQTDGTLTENALRRERDNLEIEQLKSEGIHEEQLQPMIPDTILDKALSFLKSEKKKLGY